MSEKDRVHLINYFNPKNLMATKTREPKQHSRKVKKQQRSGHVAYVKLRNRRFHQKAKADKINTLTEQALALLESSENKAAYDKFEQILQIDPYHTTTLNNYGFVLAKSKEYEAALNKFEQVLQINPNHLNALFNYATSLSNLDRYEEAIDVYARMLPIKPEAFEPFYYYYYYGIALKQVGNYEAALEKFVQALKVKPTDLELLTEYGITLRKLGHYEAAIEHFKHILQRNPKDSEVLENYGLTLDQSGQYEAAIEKFEQALQIHPEDVGVLHNCGLSLLNAGQDKAAIEKFEQAIQKAPDDLEILISYSAALLYSIRYETAIIILERALNIASLDYRVLNNYGYALVKTGHYKSAIEKFDQILQMYPQDIEALFNGGMTLAFLHQYEAAIKRFEHILSLPPDSQEDINSSYLMLGILHYRINSKKEGDRYFNLAIEQSTDKDATRLQVAQQILAADPYNEKGVTILQEITETSPHRQEAFKSLTLNLSSKAFFQKFNTRPVEDNSLKDTQLLNRALYHKIANEIAILKETIYLLLSGYQINDPRLSEILQKVEAILAGIAQRRAQEKAGVKGIPSNDYDALLTTIANTAHDISDFVNNELATIEERIRLMLLTSEGNDIFQNKLRKMLAQIKISQSALNDLKSVNEGIKIRYSHFPVRDLFENWRQTPTFSRATITLDIQNEESMFYGDEEKIKSFVKELVENSLRHNADHANLRIHIASHDELNPPHIPHGFFGEQKFLSVIVRDNGKGVPPDKKEWIFLPLTTTSVEGSGLGLFMIRRTLQEMHGHILETGAQGAQFNIFIPYVQGGQEWNN